MVLERFPFRIGVLTPCHLAHVHHKSTPRFLVVNILLVLVVVLVVDEVDIALGTPVHGPSGYWFMGPDFVSLPVLVGEEGQGAGTVGAGTLSFMACVSFTLSCSGVFGIVSQVIPACAAVFTDVRYNNIRASALI
jgi:hypothetical protein